MGDGRYLQYIDIYRRSFGKMLRVPSCLELSAFSCCSPEKVMPSTPTLHGRSFGKTLRVPSCLELSAFSCCLPEKVMPSTQTFRLFRSRRYKRSSSIFVTHAPRHTHTHTKKNATHAPHC